MATPGDAVQPAAAPASPRRPGRPAWPWLALVPVLALAGLAISHFLSHPSRDPIEFVPSSTQAAVAVDVRVTRAPALKLAHTWSVSDLQQLSERTIDLAQRLVNWTGLDLDLRKDVRPWFGGEFIAVSVEEPGVRPLSPNTLVLILRTKSERRTWAALDKAVRPFVREADWRRRSVNHSGTPVTVWVDHSDQEQLACAVTGGCALLGKSSNAVGHCLLAGARPEDRLASTKLFQSTVADLDRDGVAWAYFEAGAARGLAPVLLALSRGWIEAARAYLRVTRDAGEATPGAGGTLAIGMIPEREGVRLRGIYRSPKSALQRPVPPGRVAQLLPKDAAGYVLARRSDQWATGTLIPPLGRGTGRSLGLSIMGFRKAPSELAIALLPRGRAAKPATVVLAPADAIALPPRGFLSVLSRKPASATVGTVGVVASDGQALRQCLAAAQNEKLRFPRSAKGTPLLEAMLRPAQFSDDLSHWKEIRLTAWATHDGGEGELWVNAPPRYLMGGS